MGVRTRAGVRILAVALALSAPALIARAGTHSKPHRRAPRHLLPRRNPAVEAATEAIEKADRKELVIPAPKGFKPLPFDRKVRVTLVARDKVIHVGDHFWYRIEVQNVGRKTIDYWEQPSFLKDGLRYDMGRWDFRATLPNGTTKVMVIGALADEWGMEDRPKPKEEWEQNGLTEAQKKEAYEVAQARRRANRDLDVDLAPGETLVSRPWRWVTDREYSERVKKGEKPFWPGPAGPFRELWTAFEFDRPGTYTITATLSDPPSPMPDKGTLREMERNGLSLADVRAQYQYMNKLSFGVIDSNPVRVQVVP